MELWNRVILLLVIACLGCNQGGRSSRASDAFTVRDSAGIEIAESAGPNWAESMRWTLESQPSIIIRTKEVGDAEFILQTVGNIVPLSDGRLLVENRSSREFLVFDSSAGFIEAWGSQDQLPRRVPLPDGERFVTIRPGLHHLLPCNDDRAFGIEFLQGKLLDSEGRAISTGSLAGLIGEIVGLLDDCSTVIMTNPVDGWIPYESAEQDIIPLGQGQGPGVIPAHLFRISLIDETVDTLGIFPGAEFRLRPWYTFSYAASYAAAGGGIYYGWGDEPEILVLEGSGMMRRIIRWHAGPQRITSADWAAYSEERRLLIEQEPRLAGVIPGPGDHLERKYQPFFSADYDYPRENTAFMIDDEDNLWVRQYTRPSMLDGYSTPAGTWWVFDPAGRWLGEVETPMNFLLRHIGRDHVYGVFRNGFDVEEVHRYALRKPGN